MRRRLILGLGLAGLFAGATAAQLPAAPPAAGGAYTPGGIGAPPAPDAGRVLPSGYTTVPPAGAAQPAVASPPPMNLEIHSALGNHEWALKPEHGAYFICVKSYSRPSKPTDEDRGPSALQLAEALAADIRDAYRVQAFLYEHISEERRAEAAAIAAARERGRAFSDQMEKYKQQAQLQGTTFLAPDNKMRFKTVKYRDQIAVLVGGFKTDEDAREALDKVRGWAAPKTKVKDANGREASLMDWGSVAKPGPDGKQYLQQSFINPYLTASVVPNPAAPRATPAGQPTFDPFLIRLNEDRPYSLLTATKTWTLAVKSFSAPVEIVGRDSDNSLMRKGSSSKGADALKAGAVQAESLAKALREMKRKDGQPLGEAFVLHTRNASLVTMGQFDGPYDPALLDLKQLLETMKVNVTEDKTGFKPAMNVPTLFGNLMPIPIPKP